MQTYDLTLVMAGNFTVGSGFGLARLVDQTTVRDAAGVTFIPGATVKGRLRSICKRLALSTDAHYQSAGTAICQVQGDIDSAAAMCKNPNAKCLICSIFGSPLFPSPYRFSDFVLQTADADAIRLRNGFRLMGPKADAEWLTRVRKNRYTNVAEAQALFCLEQAAGQAKKFIGAMTGPVLPPLEEKLLKDGLRALTHLGGGRSRGLGKIEKVESKRLGL